MKKLNLTLVLWDAVEQRTTRTEAHVLIVGQKYEKDNGTVAEAL